MRELKFRAYSKSLCIIIPYEEMSGKLSRYGVRSTLADFLQNPDYEVMQSTGLTDNLQRDIYEGDILLDNGTAKKVIWFEEGAQFIVQEPSGEWDIMTSTYCGGSYEVIGNIYQTPELIHQ